MVSWTTNVAEIAPAVAKFGRPLRLLRIPVDDWAVALALALRAFPMLIDEFRVLYAARKLRPKRCRRPGGRAGAVGRSSLDLLAAAITVALRRADEMGDAITARGGTGQISAVPSRPETRDRVAFAIVAGGVRRGADPATHAAGHELAFCGSVRGGLGVAQGWSPRQSAQEHLVEI